MDQQGEQPTQPTPKPPASAPTDRAAAAGLPPDSGPEVRVLRLRPAIARGRPVAFLLVVLGLLLAAAGALYVAIDGGKVLFGDTFWLVVCGLVGVGGLVTLFVWWLGTLSASLEVTNKRTVERRGLFSRATSEVLHDNIRNIKVDQTFMDRICNVGTIGISSSGTEGIEVTMKNLRNPHGVREIIDKYRPL